MSRPELCVGAVVRKDASLLMVRRGQPPGRGRWSLPGGRVEGSELLAAAVERETAEETGVRVRCGDLVGWAEVVGEGFHYIVFDFEAEPDLAARTGLAVSAGGDAADARWISTQELSRLDLVEGLAAFLAHHRVAR